MGKWVGSRSTMGATQAMLIEGKCELMNDSADDILESIGIGFRGMSGALAISDTGKCVGMFVKRVGEPTVPSDRQGTVGFPTSWFEKMFLPSVFARLDSIDARLENLEEGPEKRTDKK